MNVLIACEFSGVVRDAFLDAGHYALSVDLLPTESRYGNQSDILCGDGRYHPLMTHFQGDIRDVLSDPEEYGDWDLMIAFPPCTYVCSSGLHWNKRRPERAVLTDQAVEFARFLLNANIPRIALENPVGCLSTRIRKPDQIIQPWQFGDDASKQTCLWLKNLPPLKRTREVAARMVGGKPRWSNQTDSGQNKLGPSANRGKERSVTYPGIASAMADQWGVL